MHYRPIAAQSGRQSGNRRYPRYRPGLAGSTAIMVFLGESIFIVTLLRADSWSEFSGAPEETADLGAKVTLASKAVLVGLIAETGGNGDKAVGTLLN